MRPLKQSISALSDRLFKRYFDELHDRLVLAMKTESSDVHTLTRATSQETREVLQQSVDETRGEILREVLRDVDETRGELLRDVDETRGELLRDVDETRGEIQRHMDETRGEILREVLQDVDETRGEILREVLQDVDETRGELIRNLDQTRGQLQNDLARARDEVHGEVKRLRHVFDDFRSKVEPRVVAIEERLDSLELRIMTLESEQQDYEKARSRDLAAARKEAGALRSDMRSDIVELTRMLRMQGDSSDQVAEALGRTIARLSAEVDTLAEVVDVRTAKVEAPGPV